MSTREGSSPSCLLRGERLGLVIAAAAFVLYLPTLSFEFVWDDRYFIVRNESLRDLANFGRYFHDSSTTSSAHHMGEIYRPLRNVTYAVDYALSRALVPRADPVSAAMFHFTNIVLHALATWLVWWLARGLLGGGSANRGGGGGSGVGDGGGSGGGGGGSGVGGGASPENAAGRTFSPAFLSIAPAAAAALFWAVHPLATEAVCWVKCRDDLLVTVFFLAGAGLAARWSDARLPRLGQWLAVAGLHLGAVLSKETGVVFPVLLVLSAWAGRQRRGEFTGLGSRADLRLLAVGLGLGAAVNLPYLLMRSAVLGEVAQLAAPLASGGDLFWTQLRATATGLSRVVWPFPLLADYQAYPISRGVGIVEVAALATLLGLFAAAWMLRRRAPLFTLAVAWWFVVILPVSNFVPTMQFLAERFLYPALAGAAIAFGAGAGAILARPGAFARRALVVIAVMLVGFTARTLQRMPVWANNLSLYAATAAAAPENSRALSNYAGELFHHERYGEALEVLRRMAAQWPGHPFVLDMMEDTDYLAAHGGEIAPTLDAVDADPGAIAPRLRLGELAWRARLPETARRQFQEVLRRDARQWRAWAGLAIVEARRGNSREAAEALERARELHRQALPADEAARTDLEQAERQVRRGAWLRQPDR